MLGNFPRLAFRQICQHNDGYAIIHVSIDRGLEALPGAVVADHAMSFLIPHKPSETVSGTVSPFIRAAVF